jgi:guanylate kinase
MDGKQARHSELLEKVRSYKMPRAAQNLLAASPPLVIAGITASGKNSVVRYLAETSAYRHVITHTTRPPREDDDEAHEYYFVSEEEMMKLIDSQAMIEAKQVHSESVYGTSIKAYQDVVKSGYKPTLVVDIQGVDDISRYIASPRPYFLVPPSFEDWMRMLEKRGKMSHSERLRRMHSAKVELESALRNERFSLIINRDIPRTAQIVAAGGHDQSSQHDIREVIQLLIERLKTL